MIAVGLLGCGGSAPQDMWITRDPDAGAGFQKPEREVGVEDDGATDAATSDDTGGDVIDDSVGGTGDDATGAGGAGGGGGTGGAGGDGTGGAAGAGGAGGSGP